MSNSPAVLLLDDGELDDVQSILERLNVAYGRVCGGAIVPDMPPPRRLLVSTPRHVGEIAYNGEEGLVRIVVVDEDSPALRAQLREIGFDYLVRRPVHREALRLLLLHCLYRGDERRREPRIPVGFEISFDTGLASRNATLADLSTRGCRLLTGFPIGSGQRVQVQIPETLGASEPITLTGRVVRESFDRDIGARGRYAIALAFEDLAPEVRNELEWIIEERRTGPPTLAGADAEGASASAAPKPPPRQTEPPRARRRKRRDITETVSSRRPADDSNYVIDPVSPTPLAMSVEVKLTPPEPREAASDCEEEATLQDASPSERRRATRALFSQKVPAFGTAALRVLVGRDLSTGGMRVERQPQLAIGDRLHLAIYGEADGEPFLVWGTLARDDGERGMAIRFDELHPVVAEQLEKIVAALPAIEALNDGEAGALGTVLSEVLDR